MSGSPFLSQPSRSGGVSGAGYEIVFVDPDGDDDHAGLYILENATWNAATREFNRYDISKPAFGDNYRARTDIPGETSTTGRVFWTAQAGANPISDTYGSVGGWELGFAITQFRDFVVGGNGIELDGNGTFPFGRLIHTEINGNFYSGILTNLFSDGSGVDDDGEPSWFGGRLDDGFAVRRSPPAGDESDFVSFLEIDSSGNIRANIGALLLGAESASIQADGSYLYLKDPSGGTRAYIGQVGVDNRIIFDLQTADGSSSFLVRNSSGTPALTLTDAGGLSVAAGSIPIDVGAYDATTQGANISVQTIATPSANKRYLVTGFTVVTRAATVSSTLPSVRVTYTDVDSNVSLTFTLSGTLTANTVGAMGIQSPQFIYAKSGVAIQIDTTGFASSGATSMQYAVRVKLMELP